MEQKSNYATDHKHTERMREKLGPKGGGTRRLTEELTDLLKRRGTLEGIPAWVQAEFLVNCLGALEVHHNRLKREAAIRHEQAAEQRQAEATAMGDTNA